MAYLAQTQKELSRLRDMAAGPQGDQKSEIEKARREMNNMTNPSSVRSGWKLRLKQLEKSDAKNDIDSVKKLITLLEQANVLEGAANAGLRDLERLQSDHGLTAEVDLAGRRDVEARDHIEHGRLTGAVRTYDTENFPLVTEKRNIGERSEAAEELGHVLDFKKAHARALLRLKILNSLIIPGQLFFTRRLPKDWKACTT